ncbi:MAG: hypothetical protein CL920_33155 [Deltaproteobacteria bacterium]|nr:hypothetical protein [Deltaproteobacteria bacterium]MBU53572.1 hypothetical protein [Deltaproteobacteria bacterium]
MTYSQVSTLLLHSSVKNCKSRHNPLPHSNGELPSPSLSPDTLCLYVFSIVSEDLLRKSMNALQQKQVLSFSPTFNH